MTFFDLILRNLWKKKARSIGLLLAVAVAVMTVVALDVTSSGLEQSAAAIISVGKADFTVAQKGASSTLTSTIDRNELTRIRQTPGVLSAIGVLVETQHINADNPVFIEIGIQPSDLAAFGVKVVAGHSYSATSNAEVMLGWTAAANLGLHVGDHFQANGTRNTVVGIYSTGNAFGDAGAMFPLPAIQGYNRLPGIVTLAFVKVHPGYSIASVAAQSVRPSRHQSRVPASGGQREHGAGDPHRGDHRRQHHVALALRANARVRAAASLWLDPAPDSQSVAG